MLALGTSEAADFSGYWRLDLRTPAERERKVECGSAEFELRQDGNRILGSHSMVTVGCGRQNEGSSDSVKGVLVDGTAVLVVTSARNGAIVMGTAKIQSGSLRWQPLEDIRPSEIEGDSPLISGAAIFSRVAK